MVKFQILAVIVNEPAAGRGIDLKIETLIGVIPRILVVQLQIPRLV
jgi:hypothetical protein